ncbi:hypothetical protein MNB_SUP05-SYMBIONT-5-492 [hydrothermal vent metagenome]|uniref:Uncharacterized protein n=1 Tax=hydrothermal vent metagenome TaxID=652676 RepID=A0A1W1E2U9_9ZZZZ
MKAFLCKGIVERIDVIFAISTFRLGRCFIYGIIKLLFIERPLHKYE